MKKQKRQKGIKNIWNKQKRYQDDLFNDNINKNIYSNLCVKRIIK